MKKLIIMMAVVLSMVLIFTSCGSKNSIPNETRIKEDLIGYSRVGGTIASVEKLEIIETANQKSTLGALLFKIKIQYTDEKGESYETETSIIYDWTDNAGWRLAGK